MGRMSPCGCRHLQGDPKSTQPTLNLQDLSNVTHDMKRAGCGTFPSYGEVWQIHSRAGKS